MALRWPQHDPGETLEYTVDWSYALNANSIASSAWALGPGDDSGVTLGTVAPLAPLFTPTTTAVWVSGGVVGKEAVIINTITLMDGSVLKQTCSLPVGTN